MDNTAFNLLHTIVGNGHRSDRHAIMKASGAKKYVHVKFYKDENDHDGEHLPITDAELYAHLTGSVTYAVPLIGTDKLASAGLIEQDSGGSDMARRILAAAEQRGVVMFSIVVKGSDGHDGSHNWALYDGRYDPAAIRAQLRLVAEDAGASTDEIHPNNTNIRLPFGLHQRTQTRGKLVLQSGETFDNDTELDAAEQAVIDLPLNSAPPEVVSKITSKPDSNNVIRTNPTPRTATGSIDTRAIAAATRERFNAEHDWADLLEQYGGVQTRDGWRCNCGWQHTHDVQIAITSKDKIVSFSPNCTWAPHKDSGKALDKFGFYVDRAHSGRYMAAVEEQARAYGLWVEPKLGDTMSPNSQPARYTDAQRQTYNAARKAKRHQETRDSLDAIYDGACNLDFTRAVYPGANPEKHADRVRWLLMRLMTECYERGVMQCALTNEQLSNDGEICKRYVSCAFRELEANGIGKRQGGRNVEGNEAAIWTFFRLPNIGCKPQQDAICNLKYIELDLVPDQYNLVSGPPNPTREGVQDVETNEVAERGGDGADDAGADRVALRLDAGAGTGSRAGIDSEWLDSPDWTADSGDYTAESPAWAASLDEWEWQDDGHGADELSAVELPKSAELRECVSAPVLRTTAGRYYVTDGQRFGAWAATEAGAWEAWEPSTTNPVLDGVCAAEPAVENSTPDDDYAASYTPVALPDRPYTGTPREYLTLEQRRDLAREMMRPREQPEGTVNLLTLGDADSDDPLIRVAPSDPKLAREYWQLKHKKAATAKQAMWMARRIRELEVLLPLSEWHEQPVARRRAAHKLPTAPNAQGAFL